ncbi:hypothetical protein SB49_05900 [Sediminicola sp. YIK13]|uniref:hypothetical protein n=1 Tax=Sediminicola sp. YIK13 TaxID=1453352 RepID=UPI0007227C8F|nr:hypothetical protein [Sediminicola sp. YIK13]ALM07387.1 hypothetical protein SB49_05900 [Sediminicola sp. YIK13]
MNINKYIATLGLLLFLTVASFAQDRPDREKIKALKVAFITERLDLSSKEAQLFWPIYNEHESNMEDIRVKEWSQVRYKIKKANTLSEQEADDLLGLYTSLEKEKQDSYKRLFNKLKNVLSSKKTLLLIQSEDDFKRKLMQMYRQKQRNN